MHWAWLAPGAREFSFFNLSLLFCPVVPLAEGGHKETEWITTGEARGSACTQ